MAAPPGWYDAGVSGQVRWWDGVRWTDQVAGVPAPGSQHPQPVLGAVRAQPKVTLPSAAPGPAMGWYPTTAGRLRWWDGRRWTGLRVKNGKPGSDWATTERPVLIIILGGLMLGVAVVQLLLALSYDAQPPTSLLGVPTLILAVLWITVGAQTLVVRRFPAPSGPPAAPEAVQPLPETVEGVGARWVPLTPQVSRWWTGARWTHYMTTRFGVRPAFHGPRMYRVFVIMFWVLIGGGLASVVVGIVLLVIGADPEDIQLTSAGVGFLVSGIVGTVIFGIFALTANLRRLLLLPEDAPQPTPGG